MMRTHFDAIVVGAGPAGSTAAVLLAQAGWSVALIERLRFPRRKVCGECIAASNLPLLDALGLGAAFRHEAGPALRQVALMKGKATLVADLPAAEDLRHPWGHALGRETLDTLLLERARSAGAVVLQPWAVESIEGRTGDHRCVVRALTEPRPDATSTPSASADGAATMPEPGRSLAGCESSAVMPGVITLQSAIVIDAHGSWEALRSTRETLRAPRRPSDLFAFKANFTGSALPAGLLPVLCLAGGYGGMVVGERGVTTLACCVRRDRLEACRRAWPDLPAGEAVEAWLKQDCAGVADALGTARRDGAWLASGPIRPGVRIDEADGSGVFRIGNAAGEAHPIIGEGISMAMQSAWLLSARLLEASLGARRHLSGGEVPVLGAEDEGRPARPFETQCPDGFEGHAQVSRRYAADWRRHFATRLRLAAAFAHVAMRPAAAAPLMALLGRWPGLLTQGARWAGKGRCAADPATIALLERGQPAGVDAAPASGLLSPRG
jgi:flavin-dependent dehydrogenase